MCPQEESRGGRDAGSSCEAEDEGSHDTPDAVDHPRDSASPVQNVVHKFVSLSQAAQSADEAVGPPRRRTSTESIRDVLADLEGEQSTMIVGDDISRREDELATRSTLLTERSALLGGGPSYSGRRSWWVRLRSLLTRALKTVYLWVAGVVERIFFHVSCSLTCIVGHSVWQTQARILVVCFVITLLPVVRGLSRLILCAAIQPPRVWPQHSSAMPSSWSVVQSLGFYCDMSGGQTKGIVYGAIGLSLCYVLFALSYLLSRMIRIHRACLPGCLGEWRRRVRANRGGVGYPIGMDDDGGVRRDDDAQIYGMDDSGSGRGTGMNMLILPYPRVWEMLYAPYVYPGFVRWVLLRDLVFAVASGLMSPAFFSTVFAPMFFLLLVGLYFWGPLKWMVVTDLSSQDVVALRGGVARRGASAMFAGDALGRTMNPVVNRRMSLVGSTVLPPLDDSFVSPVRNSDDRGIYGLRLHSATHGYHRSRQLHDSPLDKRFDMAAGSVSPLNASTALLDRDDRRAVNRLDEGGEVLAVAAQDLKNMRRWRRLVCGCFYRTFDAVVAQSTTIVLFLISVGMALPVGITRWPGYAVSITAGVLGVIPLIIVAILLLGPHAQDTSDTLYMRRSTVRATLLGGLGGEFMFGARLHGEVAAPNH